MRVLIKYFVFIILIVAAAITGYIVNSYSVDSFPKVQNLPIPKDNSLEIYFIENLAGNVKSGDFKIGEVLKSSDLYTSNLFEFEFYPNPTSQEKKITTGVINIPVKSSLYPIIFMIRGYVDQKLYTSGMGTRHAAEYFAQNGFITVAPDFLGYAGSSPEAGNIFETRFQTYSTVIALHKSLPQIPAWDGKNIFIWAHSNGGQIALSWITSENLNYPTVLWAPVTKAFPYSVLYYTDESADGGKLIRTELAKLEENYDVDKFSFTTYFDRLQAPMQIHKGTNDDAIPNEWIVDFVNRLKSQKTPVEYFSYPGDDHNISKNWDLAVKRSLEFFNNNIK